MTRKRFLILCTAIILVVALLPCVLLAAAETVEYVGSVKADGCGGGVLGVTLPEYAFAGTTVSAAVNHEGTLEDEVAFTPSGELAPVEGYNMLFLATGPGKGTVSVSGTLKGCGGTDTLATSATVNVLETVLELQSPSTIMTVGSTFTPAFGYSPSATAANVPGVDQLWATALTQLITMKPVLSVSGKAVSVSGSSLVAMEEGTATVTATVPGTSISTAFTVNVVAAENVVPVTTLAVQSTATCKVGESVTITPVYAPANATNAGGTWSLSKQGVVSVSGNTFTALAAGKVTATYTLADSTKSVSCVITVSAGGPIPVAGVTMANEKHIKVGETVALTPVFTPADASNKNGSWLLSADGIVSRYNNTFTGLKAGTVNVIFQSEDGDHMASCKIVVTGDATITPEAGNISSVTVNKSDVNWIGEELSLRVDATYDVVYTVDPADADTTALSWTTGSADVLTAYQGTLTAMGPGTTTVKVAYNGKELASFTVTVE